MAIPPVWQYPLQQPALSDNQVHVWCADLNLPDLELARLGTFLSDDEIARANKFRFVEHQKRFTAARGILRQLLANYLQISPCEVKFDYSDRGKPSLSGCHHNHHLQFNLSHSQNHALYGFTLNDLIGVDVEYIKDMPDAIKIAQRFFSTQEYELIKSTAIKEQERLFFTLWTAKEAYLKALGTGLAGSLDTVEIEVNPTRLRMVAGSKVTAGEWELYSCSPKNNYIGAIAIKSDQPNPEISFWSWHHSQQFSTA